jgi:phytoene dehydrogenase-like protein
VKINLALDRLPVFRCMPAPPAGSSSSSAPQPYHHGTIHFESDLATIEAAHADAVAGRPSARPVIEMTLPSALDDSLAPPGKHVCLLFVQYAPYDVPGGWDAPGARQAFADSVFAVIEKYAPGFTASIIGQPDILMPPDLERIFSLPGGNIFHGAMSLDQLLWLRPFAGATRYAVPSVQGLYFAGAGAHPGGGVMGAAGRNAALTCLADMGRRGR